MIKLNKIHYIIFLPVDLTISMGEYFAMPLAVEATNNLHMEVDDIITITRFCFALFIHI